LSDLQRGGLTAKLILPALSAPQWGYRRRARLAVQRAKDGKFLIGFRNAGSQRVEPITQCPVLTAPLPDVVAALPEWLALLPLAIKVFEVELVSADSSFAIAVEASRLPADSVMTKLLEGLQAMGLGCAQLWWKSGKQAQFTRCDGGGDRLSFAVSDAITVNFEPGQFIQVNGEVNRLMVEQMLSLLPTKGGRAIDLYCGTGNLSLPLTQRFEQVIGIEGLPTLVKAAVENARINNLTNVDFHVADLTSADALTKACGPKGLIDFLLLDPPRNGAAGVMPWIAKSGAKQILYISCHPATMIRDAEILTKVGYQLSAVGVMGMFPHTTHIEVMALFEKSKN
jgi:23S rRNA (uracil1939-C5)-methyltransferase